ncbi:unnamed protein product [Rhizoctonia solani]|uniref:Uncharacterized protein n=1 Tax=Rhizoctonia solani TaxID=456999 RepID=A0A8H3E1T7_9AGAM|nr:unnamed protein product [Rhizoctonia solani]
MSDAALGFFRSGTVHQDGDLFANIKYYLNVEKGWFSPYLFASSRRPVIPRSMKPDIVFFCHGPFLLGDYRIAETLLAESASIIKLCLDPPTARVPMETETSRDPIGDINNSLSPKYSMLKASDKASELDHKVSSYWHRPASPTPVDGKVTLLVPVPDSAANTQADPQNYSPNHPTTPLPAFIPITRRILVVVLGISPHRKLWTTSARPGESVMNSHLLNGCPALVLPAVSAKGSTPLVAWDTLTLNHLHTIGKEKGGVDGETFKVIATCLFEYLSLCVEWDHIVIPEEIVDRPEGAETITSEELKKKIVRGG